MERTTKVHLPVFNGKQESWQVWKMKFVAYTIRDRTQYDLLKTCKNEEVIPQDKKEKEQHEAAKDRLYSNIVLAISDDCIKHLDGVEIGDGRAAWKGLLNQFERSSSASKRKTLGEFFKLQMQQSEQISDYIFRIHQKQRLLKSFEIKLDDEITLTVMLTGLPGRFEQLFTVINANKDITLDKAEQLLLEYDERHGRKTDHEDFGTALQATVPRTSTQRTCHGCGKPGHFISECRNTEKRSTCEICFRPGHQRQSCNSKCRHCGKVGHRHIECPTIKPQKDEAANIATDHREWAFTTTSSNNTTNHSNTDEWILDSGASSHLTSNKNDLTDFEPTAGQVHLADNSTINILGSGTVGTLTKVKFVPKLTADLLSVPKLTDDDKTVLFAKNNCTITDLKTGIKVIGRRSGNLYYLPKHTALTARYRTTRDAQLWHHRLGHVSYQTIKLATNKNLISGVPDLEIDGTPNCEDCMAGKCSRIPFPQKASHRATQPLALIHTDICHVSTLSHNGYKYFVVFIDDATRYGWVYFLKLKSDVLHAFKKFRSDAEPKTGQRVKQLRSDNAPEYTEGDFRRYCIEHGINQQTTVPHCSQQNGVAERFLRTLQEMGRCLVIKAKLEKIFWDEAINTAVHIRNRLPTRSNEGNLSPTKMLFDKTPDVSYFRVFGCVCYAHLENNERKRGDKFEPTGRRCRFIGYCRNTKGYRVLDESSQRVYVRRHVRFLEELDSDQKQQPVQLPPQVDLEIPLEFVINEEHIKTSTTEDRLEQHTDDDLIPRPNENYKQSSLSSLSAAIDNNPIEATEDTETKHSENTSQLPKSSMISTSNGGDTLPKKNVSWADQLTSPNSQTSGEPLRRRSPRFTSTDDDAAHYALAMLVVEQTSAVTTPTSYNQAVNGLDKDKWASAIDNELDSMQQHTVWREVELPAGRKPISSKWVFKVKQNADGSVDKYKARLCARGFTQIPGIDFFDTFSPVAKWTTIRTLLSLATALDFDIAQLDVKTAFLYGKLDEEIYMSIPHGYKPKKRNTVLKLDKALYGLKQAGKQWYASINQTLMKMNFVKSQFDPCLYICKERSTTTYACIYVDDILLTSNSKSKITQVTRALSFIYQIEDKGEPTWYLGIELKRDRKRRTISLSQRSYINSILKRFQMEDSRPMAVPADNERLQKNAGESPTLQFIRIYQEMVGSVLYAALTTRPDIFNAVVNVARYAANPNKSHLSAVKRIIQYLKQTQDRVLVLGELSNDPLTGYCDADYAGDLDQRRSTSGNVFQFRGSTISWSSRIQRSTALSTAEAEYMSLADAAKEAIWLRGMLTEMTDERTATSARATILHEDNQACISIATNPGGHHSKVKHIDVRYHFVRDLIEDQVIHVQHCPTDQMLADGLTKPLPKPKHNEMTSLLLNDKRRED